MAELKLSTGKHGRGIKYHEHNRKWEARIMVGGKRVTLGYFDLASDAETAYANAKKATKTEALNFLKPSEEEDAD